MSLIQVENKHVLKILFKLLSIQMNVQTEAHLASSTVKEESQRNPHSQNVLTRL